MWVDGEQPRSIKVIPLTLVIGSLSNYYGYGNEYSTKHIGFNEQTNGLRVRCTFWYIYLTYSAEQQRGMTKFKFCGEREHTTITFPFSI